MGYYCTVPQCTSLAGKTKNVKFHRFPRDESMADKWNVILKRGKPYTKYSKVCSLHFTQADYNVTTMGQWKTLSKDAVPSQNLPKLNADGTVMVIRKSRTVKYREAKKDDLSDKTEKWSMPIHHGVNAVPETPLTAINEQESNLQYRLQTLNSIANTISPQTNIMKPKKQDAFMQTDPVQSEEDDTQPNNSYSETSEKSYSSEQLEYPVQYPESAPVPEADMPKDYTKNEEDYIPQTNEEYNKEAEKYALERKSHNAYDKVADSYQKGIDSYPKGIEHPSYPKIQDVYGFDKGYSRSDYVGYPNEYPDSVEMLRNQQHNIQMLQEQHRITENQNFFNESHIKQEVDISADDDKYIYERAKDQIESNPIFENRLLHQQRLMEQLRQVKQEPETSTGSDNVMQPQGSPYYQTNGHTNVPGAYYEGLSRPGPELLIAKQNALAAHTQLWQNTMKRPFFYSESTHYTAPPILHRFEDIPRILQ